MTNTAGGCLFLGVEDDGTITGVHKKHRDPIGVTAVSYTHLKAPKSTENRAVKNGCKLLKCIQISSIYIK